MKSEGLAPSGVRPCGMWVLRIVCRANKGKGSIGSSRNSRESGTEAGPQNYQRDLSRDDAKYTDSVEGQVIQKQGVEQVAIMGTRQPNNAGPLYVSTLFR